MKLEIQVPDDMLNRVKEKLPPPEMGVLEAVALDAVLGFLLKLDDGVRRGTEQEGA
jgi:hypothetical protein